MNIRKKTNSHNTAPRNSSIKYLVLHYTGSTHSEKGTAYDTCCMFASPSSRAASADFVVDDGEVCQYNPDIKNRKCYAVGGTGNPKKYKMSTHLGGKLYGKVTNENSISIEMKSSKKNRKSLKDSDTDWYLTDAVVERSAELAAYLLKKYNIPFERMVMHHMVSYYGKLCPLPWCQKESDLKGWEDFKKRVKKYMGGKVEAKPSNPNAAKPDTIKGESDKDRFIRTFGYWCNKDLGTDFKNKPQFDKLKEVIKSHNLVEGCRYNGMVKHLQYWLNKLIKAGLDEDGDFGPKTKKAVIELQKKIGSGQDGEFGSGTLTKMVEKMF